MPGALNQGPEGGGVGRRHKSQDRPGITGAALVSPGMIVGIRRSLAWDLEYFPTSRIYMVGLGSAFRIVHDAFGRNESSPRFFPRPPRVERSQSPAASLRQRIKIGRRPGGRATQLDRGYTDAAARHRRGKLVDDGIRDFCF